MTWFFRMPPPYLVIALLGVLSVVAAFWAAHEQQKETRELLSQVTGGESFVYVEPLRKEGRIRYFVRHTGNHPTYDVVVRVQEVDVLGTAPTGKRKREEIFGPVDAGRTLLRGSGYDWTYPPTADARGRVWPLVFSEPPLCDAGSREFRIELAARNGIVVQRFRVWPVGDRWHTESWLVQRPGAGALTLPADYKEAHVQPENPPEVYDDGK
jgi:hypothetical protein